MQKLLLISVIDQSAGVVIKTLGNIRPRAKQIEPEENVVGTSAEE